MYIQDVCSLPSNSCLCSPTQQPYTLLLGNISFYFILQLVIELVTFVSLFLHSMPYLILSFLNMTVLHYIVFKQAVFNQTSNWRLVGYCITSIAVAPLFPYEELEKRRAQGTKRLRNCTEHSLSIYICQHIHTYIHIHIYTQDRQSWPSG
jgi:hypothetical protein